VTPRVSEGAVEETRIRQSEYLREAIGDLLEKYDGEMLD